jgi:hypothetical protein
MNKKNPFSKLKIAMVLKLLVSIAKGVVYVILNCKRISRKYNVI